MTESSLRVYDIYVYAATKALGIIIVLYIYLYIR
jgi:hypothetical protein